MKTNQCKDTKTTNKITKNHFYICIITILFYIHINTKKNRLQRDLNPQPFGPKPNALSNCAMQPEYKMWDLNPRSITHGILRPAPLTRLGKSCKNVLSKR